MKTLKGLFTPRETMMLVALGSFLIGLLIALNLRFPVKYENISKASMQCKDHTAYSFKVSLLGDVAEISCLDGTVIKIYYPR